MSNSDSEELVALLKKIGCACDEMLPTIHRATALLKLMAKNEPESTNVLREAHDTAPRLTSLLLSTSRDLPNTVTRFERYLAHSNAVAPAIQGAATEEPELPLFEASTAAA